MSEQVGKGKVVRFCTDNVLRAMTTWPGPAGQNCNPAKSGFVADGDPFVSLYRIKVGDAPAAYDVKAGTPTWGQAGSICEWLAANVDVVAAQEFPDCLAPHIGRVGGPHCWTMTGSGTPSAWGRRTAGSANYPIGDCDLQAVGSRWPIVEVERSPYPVTRVMLVSYIAYLDLYVICLHWSGPRGAQTEAWRQWIDGYAGKRTILAGDGNCSLGSLAPPGWPPLASHFPDHIVASPALGDCRVPGTYSGPVSGLVSPTTGLRLSDHDPVVCTLNL